MFPEAAYLALELPLKPGDRYVLYTDGLTESKNAADEEFGLARCKQFLESHARLTASALADALLGEIARWSIRASRRLQEDDMTLIVIDWHGQT
jgi:sigma-B regulation protein RsbU (phosphoserine phosphatase)